MTDYIVLRRAPQSTQNWQALGVATANGPDQAIREIAKSEPGVYVAVPTRSWHERDGAPEVVERFKLTEKDKPDAHPGQTKIDEALAEAEAPAAA